MRREFSVIIEKDEDGWFVATVPELKGCHTQAKSLDKLLTRVREASNCGWKCRRTLGRVRSSWASSGLRWRHEQTAADAGPGSNPLVAEGGI